MDADPTFRRGPKGGGRGSTWGYPMPSLRDSGRPNYGYSEKFNSGTLAALTAGGDLQMP